MHAVTDRFNEFLKKNHVEPGDIDRIEELLMIQDPHYEPLSHSLYLYEHAWWGGYGIVLPGGTFNWWTWKISGRAFPDLGVFGMDNKASSLATWGSDHAYCYTDKYYGGARLLAWCAIGDLNALLGVTFGDSIPSAIVY